MKQYNVLNTCLNLLKGSRIDVMTKLRIESLLVGMKMLLLLDADHEGFDLDELCSHVNAVCAGESGDGVSGLVECAKKLRSSMAACLDVAA